MVSLWSSELGFLSATDLDLSLFGPEVLGSDLDSRQVFVGFVDVVGADTATVEGLVELAGVETDAVGLVVVEEQVISWVLTEGLGWVISLVLAEDLVDLG